MVDDARAFIDTNVLLYAYDASEGTKHPVAVALLARLWRERTGVLSTQVLQEFYSVATSKRRPPMSASAARDVIDIYRGWPVTVIEPAIILAASHLQERHRLSFWDALIVQAAVVAGATTLWTEDLATGQIIEGVRVVDPFRGGAGPDRSGRLGTLTAGVHHDVT